MKRLSAILFLLVLLFNFYGYRMVIAYMEKDNTATVEQKLDKKEYSDNELISIKTTLNLPYYSSSPSYERAYGSVSIDGIVYEYVKKRVYKDTLELLCLPNASKTKMQTVSNELAKSSAEGEASLPVKKGTAVLKISLPDYCQMQETASQIATPIKRNFILQNERFSPFAFQQQQERPPQASCILS